VALGSGRWLLRALGRYPRRRRWLVIAAAGAGAAALFALGDVAPVRALAWRGAGGALLSAALGLVGDAPAALPGTQHRLAPRPSVLLILAASVLVVAAARLAPRVPIGTQQW